MGRGISAEHVRNDYGPIQAARAAGITPKEWRRLVKAGYAEAPDLDGKRWSLSATIRGVDAAGYLIGDGWPIGAVKAAERINWRLQLAPGTVTADDIGALAEAGVLEAADEYKGHDLYDRGALDKLDEDTIESARADRAAWREASLTSRDAAAMLEWSEYEFTTAAHQRGIEPGRGGRWARVDVATLADDEELAETIASARTLGPDQSAEYLEIRRVDLDCLVAAGLLKPAAHVTKPVGRRSEVRVPLYRAGDLDALLDVPGIDWEAVRATEPGRPSPLRALAPRRDRPGAVRRFAADLAEAYGVEVWTRYRAAGAVWEIDWSDRAGAPSVEEVRERLAADAALAGDDRIHLESGPGEVARWARAMLRPGAAILDTETNGLYGEVLQLAVVDAATGAVLLDSLVNPGPDTEWSTEAQHIHGIGPDTVATAPTWPEIHDAVLAALAGRTIVAYNVAYDLPVIRAEAHRHGLTLGDAGDADRWACAMEARSAWWEQWSWIPLGGAHAAIGDCLATRAVLQSMTRPPWAPPVDDPDQIQEQS